MSTLNVRNVKKGTQINTEGAVKALSDPLNSI
jgi:hypothetical protein